MRVTLPYPVSSNRLWRSAHGRQYANPAAVAWKRQAGWIARGEWASPSAAPMSVSVWLHPKQTKQGRAGKRRLDLDNALKGALDALNGVVWLDDSQVVEIHAAIGEARAGGGLTVEIREVAHE